MPDTRELALGIASAIQAGPDPLPIELRNCDPLSAANLVTELARELVDAGININRVEVPPAWFVEINALLDEHALALPIVSAASMDNELRIFRGK